MLTIFTALALAAAATQQQPTSTSPMSGMDMNQMDHSKMDHSKMQSTHHSTMHHQSKKTTTQCAKHKGKHGTKCHAHGKSGASTHKHTH